MLKIQLVQVNESALMITFGDRIDPELPHYIARLNHTISQQLGTAITDAIPSYTSLLLEYHPLKITARQLMTSVQSIQKQLEHSTERLPSRTIILPVYYGAPVAPDLDSLARTHQLSPEEVIAIHSQQQYSVCAIGFAPGFAFLAAVDPLIATPRHPKPRRQIPAGSVGIADKQTAVYPNASPGGWQIIGNCPCSLFDPMAEPIMPFSVGDTVKFKPIDVEEYQSLGGKLCQDWK